MLFKNVEAPTCYFSSWQEFHKTGAAQCTGLKLTTVDNFRKITVVLKEQSNFTLLQKYILALV